MAVLSDYTSGTITLANGSTAVTGTGTLFDVAKFREGDTLQIQNLTAVIASVNSNTSLTLTAPWTGTSLNDAPYRARYLPDGARVTAQATTLIELLGNGVLSNLAELGVEDGKVPVGNAAGEYELADLVTDPNGSLAKLAALTVAARQIFQTDENGALKAIALAADKLLNTDANGDILLSDITPFARTVLDDASGSAMFATMGARIFGSGDNGGVVFPNGIIIQWGFIGTVSGAGTLITYPEAFPSSCFVFNAQIFTDYRSDTFAPLVYADWDFSSGGLSQRSIWTRQINQNGSSVTVTGLNDMNIRWFAIGR